VIEKYSQQKIGCHPCKFRKEVEIIGLTEITKNKYLNKHQQNM